MARHSRTRCWRGTRPLAGILAASMATGLLLWTSCVRQGPNPSKASAHASSVGAIRSLSPVDWTKGVKQLGVLDGLLPVFSADSRTVATVSLEDQTTMLWDVSSGGLLFAFEGYWVTPRGPHDPFAPDGQVIAVPTGENGPTNLWEVSTGRQLASLKGANPHFSNDGRRVATDIGPTGFIGLGPAPEREETIVWEVPTGKRIATLEGAHAWEFAPDGSTLGIGDKLVGADSGKELVTLEGFARGFAPQGNVLATQIDRGDTPPQVKLWAVPSGQLLATLDGEFVDYAPAGTAVVTKGAVPNSVHVWDTSSGALIGTLEGQLRGFSDRGNVVAAEREVGRGPTILLRVDSGQCLGPFEGSFGCLSPDGRLLATDSPVEGDRRSYLWDVGSSQRVAELHSYTSAFSPGGEVIVGPDRTAEGKVTTRVWLASSGKLIATVDGQWRRFSPDGRAFATGPTDDPRSYERGPPTTLWGPAEVRTDGGVGELPEAPGPGTAEPRIPDGLVRPPGCSWVSVEADAPVNDAKAYLSWVSQHAPVAVRHDKTGIELVWVPGGRFIMGSTPEEIDRQWRENDWDGDLKQWTKDEQPAHRVDVAGFWIGRTEVTIGQWWQV